MTLSNQQITKRFKALATYHNANEKDLDAVQLKQHERFDRAIDSTGAIFQMGEAIDQLIANENNGLGQRAIDTQELKRKNIKKETKQTLGLSDDTLEKSSQRMSEAHRLFVYHKEIKEWLNTCDNPPSSCTNIFKNMVSEGVNPWPVADKKEKTVDDIANAINKLLEKTKFSLKNVVMCQTNIELKPEIFEALTVEAKAKSKAIYHNPTTVKLSRDGKQSNNYNKVVAYAS